MAEEVRKLAVSAKSTSQIATIIEMVVWEAAKASDAIQGVVLAVNQHSIDINKQTLHVIFTAYCGFTQIDNVIAVSQQSSAGQRSYGNNGTIHDTK